MSQVRRYYFITILTIIFLLLLSWVVLISPKIKSIQALTGRREEVKKQLEARQNALSQLKQEIQKARKFSSAGISSLIKFALPDDPDTASILLSLQKIATEEGFSVNKINFTEEKKGAGANVKDGKTISLPQEVEKMGIELELLQGSYPAFKKFLERIENNLRLMDVLSFELGLAGTESRYKVNLQTYYLRKK